MKKGDIVDFSYQPTGDGMPIQGRGIITGSKYSGFWDILCEGEYADMRLPENDFKRTGQNIFDIIKEL